MFLNCNGIFTLIMEHCLKKRHTLWYILLLGCILNCCEGYRYARNPGDCPRQPRLIEQGRKCMKKCRSDYDCTSEKKRCYCDGVCGKSCINPVKKCTSPADIDNGSYKITPFAKFGATLRYSCKDGFMLVGKSERRCQGDGTWSGEPPRCETQGRCKKPPDVPNASHDGQPDLEYYPLRTQVRYACWAGYQQDGFERAMCVGEGRWVGPRMKCSPRRCGYPGDVLHGYREGQVFTFPNIVAFHCNVGYHIVGHRTRTCQANGQWSGTLPSCRAISCPRVSEPSNGEISVDGNYRYGSVMIFRCKTGYILDGPEQRTCQKDGTWSGHQPFCQVVECELPTNFYGGYIDRGSTIYGTTIVFRCLNNANQARRVGAAEAQCQADGTWSHPVPVCLNSCALPTVNNANVTSLLQDKDPRWVAHNGTVNVTCHHGFFLENVTKPVCHNGTWFDLPTCKPAGCNSRPMQIPNGYNRYHSLRHGSRARYRCLTGYKLMGGRYAKCMYGRWEWTGDPPACKKRLCEYPGSIAHGQILLVGYKGKYEYNTNIKTVYHRDPIEFQCEKGYRREGPAGATCVDGRWSPSKLPKCVRANHINSYYSLRLG